MEDGSKRSRGEYRVYLKRGSENLEEVLANVPRTSKWRLMKQLGDREFTSSGHKSGQVDRVRDAPAGDRDHVPNINTSGAPGIFR